MTINFKNWEQTTPKSIEQVDEALKGDQHKLDVDKDGKIEKSDLKKLRSKKRDTIVFNNGEEMKENEACGKKMYREFMEELTALTDSLVEATYGWEMPEPKEKPQPTVRKIAGRAYGGAAQKDNDEEDEDDKPSSKVKRGRGRPSGSKSGARQQGNGKQYSGLPFHSLNLPSKK